MHDILLVIAGGSLITAFLKFIEFVIERFIHKKERKEDKAENIDDLRKEIKDHIEDTNREWKETLCDKNSALIEELRTAVLKLTEDSNERAKFEKYVGESLMALTHDKLVHLGKAYQKRGAITVAEQSNLTLLYRPYHDGLGGNHDGETWYNYCMNELPIVTEEKALEMDKKNA